MLLFPEGTDRGERAAQLSHAFADKNSLPRYNYVLHPRTTGFNLLLDKMEERKRSRFPNKKHLSTVNYIDCIYDITLAYDKEKEIVASEIDLLRKGKLPQVEIIYTIYLYKNCSVNTLWCERIQNRRTAKKWGRKVNVVKRVVGEEREKTTKVRFSKYF